MCDMDPRYPHSVAEHEMAEELMGPLVQYVRDDAFLRRDSPLTYRDVVMRFQLSTTVRRVGRVLDAVERILVASGWPDRAAAGVTAYVVTARDGRPSYGWNELWHMDPREARAHARAFVYQQAMEGA